MALTLVDKDTDFKAASRTRNDLLTTKYVERFIEITFDSSYPAGGEALSAADKTAIGTDTINFFSASVTVNGYVIGFDYANQKILVFQTNATSSSTLSEVVEGTNLAFLTVRAHIFGLPE